AGARPGAWPTAAAPPAPAAPAAQPPAPQPAAASGTAPVGDPSRVRQLWPDILEAVKNRRRFTWILLSQNAQVVGFDGTTLQLGFANPGARDSFVNGGSDEVLRQAVSDALGVQWKIEAIVDPSGGAGGPASPGGSGGFGGSGGGAPASPSGGGFGGGQRPAPPAPAPARPAAPAAP
ncbi:DNA polymerase III subunit gamma and tau, partial [Streptantibioticus rubrisoli]